MDEKQKRLKNMDMTAFELPELYLHAPNTDRFQSFLNNSQYVLNLLYNKKDYAPAVTRRSFTEKLTKYPKEGNMEYIKSLIELDNGAMNLIIAPTGSGKTYSIDAIFRQMNSESDGKQLLCLLCPNRVQNIQNEKSDDYSFEALVAGVQLEENEHNVRQISAVYDKVPSIINYKKAHPDCRLRLVIDECQTLISANTFREQAIDTIMRMINEKIADSYTFITATYENMCCFSFDNIVLFEDKNYKPVFKAVNIKYAKQKTFENLVVDTAIHESKPYIRLNNTEMIKRVKATLRNMGQNCYSVTADEKGSTTNEDGTVTYNNAIFDHIVNHDDLYNNEGEADTILATSLLDAGTNFTKYSPESTPVFAVFNPKLMNIDEIEQAFNRFRPQKDAEGNVIQLDHALIIHQLPSSNIRSAKVYKQDSSGKMKLLFSIPSKAITYTDNTSPEERESGKHNGLLTISGNHFSALEDGIYYLHIYFLDQTVPISYNLYVNCWSDERPDYDTMETLFKNVIEKGHAINWGGEKIKADLNIFQDALLALGDAMSGSNAFIYNTGDKEVSSQILLRPYAFFTSLRGILENYLKQAKLQCYRAHQYIETPDLPNENMYDVFAEADQEENLRETLERHLNVLKIEDPPIGKALYVAKDLTVQINRKKLFNSAYSAYQNQFYYYPERLADELTRRLNIPVSISYYTPEKHKLETVEDDRDSILQILNTLYTTPAMKSILCDVLHNGKSIPVDINREYREMLAKILQSNLYKKEYQPLRKVSASLTFDYIVKSLNILENRKQVNKHITRIIYMLNNQDILMKGSPSVKAKSKQMQFIEQKTLISIIEEKRMEDEKKSGKEKKGGKEKKKFTINEKFKETIREEFNKKMTSNFKGYIPKTPVQFKNLLYFVYDIKNKNASSRGDEVAEPIQTIEQVPFN